MNMGIQEALNQHRRITLVVTILVFVGAIAAIGVEIYSSVGGRSSTAKSFFSTDDGKTWFSGDADNLPTADDGRNPAYIATVFTCNGKEFVGYLTRYTAAGRKMALDADKVPQNMPPGRDEKLLAEIEVKRPGDTKWINESEPASAAILDVRCPDTGRPADLVAP